MDGSSGHGSSYQAPRVCLVKSGLNGVQWGDWRAQLTLRRGKATSNKFEIKLSKVSNREVNGQRRKTAAVNPRARRNDMRLRSTR